MKQNSGATESAWISSAEIPSSNLLPADVASFDVCIVGAGIAGLSCAYHLVKEGKRVLVIDKGPVGGGETCRTTAHLASAVDDRFMEMERLHGTDGAKLAYESNATAIDWIEDIVTREKIECDFQRVNGYLFAGEGAEDFLADEYEAAKRAGVMGVEYPVDCPIAELTNRPALRFPNQGQFDPIKYLAGLARAVTANGGVIVSDQLVASVKEKKGEVYVTLESERELVFPYCISATNAPIVSLTSQLKQAPYRTYAIGVDVPAGAVPRGLYWDTEDPYHYVRLKDGNGNGNDGKDLLIVGGEDHRTGTDIDPSERFMNLWLWAKKRFPGLGDIRYRWSGQVMEPVDGVAFIGKAPASKNVYIVTGDSGMGMTHGTLAGVMLTDMILGRENRFSSLYDPSRKSMRSLKEIVKEHAPDAARLGALFTPGEVKSRDDIPLGHGAIVRHGLKKVATYRDENGNFHERSAVCTHLGCVVEWNDLEKSWDCPCHGSRFGTDGQVLNSPASKPLAEHK